MIIPDVPTMPDPQPAAELAPAPRNFMRDLQRQAKQAAKETKKFVRDNPSQQLELNGKNYPRVETWQFLGACFGYTAMISKTETLLGEEGCELGFVAVAHVRSREGQIVTGAEAACMRSEADWADKPSFHLRSMAQTRSIAKAFRNLLAWVMVMAGFCPTPAEEMEIGQVAFDQIPERKQSAPLSSEKAVKLVTPRQIEAFHEACVSNGKSADEISGYLLTAHKAASIEELRRGKPFTEALRWAETRSTLQVVPQRGPQPAQKLLDLMPKHKDAYSL